MKKGLLILSLFFFALRMSGIDLYWVNGSGKWEDAKHWSAVSGGTGGVSVPGPGDHAIINEKSGLKKGDEISVLKNINCERLTVSVLQPEFKLILEPGVQFTTSSPSDLNFLKSFCSVRLSPALPGKVPDPVIYQPTSDPDTRSIDNPDITPLAICSVVIDVQTLCPGACNGQATVFVTPPGTYTFSWTNGQTTATATGLCAGQGYSVFVQNVNNPADFCQGGVVMQNYAPFTAGFINTNVLCNSFCTGQSIILMNGGTGPYTYVWQPGNLTGSTVTGLCAGTYTITVTDNNNCVFTTTTTITQPPPIQPNPTQVDVLCNPNCSGTATVSPTGGTGPYTYSWNTVPVQTTPTATGLCAGNYTVIITDANNCTQTQTFTITQPAQPLSTTVTLTGNPVLCNGDCTASSTANPAGGTPGYSYSWSTFPVQTTQTATGLCAGTYTVTVTDANGCTVTQTVTITEPSLLSANITTTNNPLLCNGNCNATATANVSGGTPAYSYLWSNGQTTVTATGLCAGTYTVTVTDFNLCTATQTVTILQPPTLVVATSSTNNPVTCFGDCNATATATPAGGTAPYTYSWNTVPVQTTPTATGLCAGTYTVIVTDANGCTSTQAVTIAQPTQIQINVNTSNNPLLCNGQCIASATANPSGGTPGYTYLWSTGATTQGIGNLCAGTYTVTVTDANGCTRTQTITITQPPLLTTTSSSTSLQCNSDCDATLAVNALGGTAPYSYLWTPGNFTTATITGQCAGTYTVVVTDANGCTSSQVINVSQPSAMSVSTAFNSPTCNAMCNGQAIALAGGGVAPYSYLWAPGGQTTATITGICGGTYTVTVTDANGCTLSQVVTVTQPTAINPGVSQTNALCNGNCNGSAVSTPSGGTGPYSFMWLPVNSTSNAISNLCAGSYTLTVTDANNCSVSTIVTITAPQVLSASISATTTSCNICNGSATVTPNGGTSPYTYLWSNGQTTQTATGLCPQSYTVTVTDANGCTANVVANIVQTVQIIITTSPTTLDCFGDCDGIATANAAGGQLPYSYLWNSMPFQTTQTATGLCSGSYTVTVTDANGCFGTAVVTFTDPPQLTLTTTSTNISCNGGCTGTGSATPGGGTPAYSYSWNTVPVQTTQTATGLCAGTYTVTVTDANGCTITSSVTIGQAPAIQINPTVVPANCTLCDGSITLNPSGGSPPYTFVWAPNVSTGSSATNLCPAIYTVTITDFAGCTVTFTVPLGNVNGPTGVITSTPATCNGGCDGTANVVPNGGTPPYTYVWNDPGAQTSALATGLCAGTYIVQITDGPGCIFFLTTVVTEPAPLIPNATVANSTCGSNCNGSITTSASGGTGPYSYSWMPGNFTTSGISNLCAGTYTLILTDVNGCDTTLSFTITAPPALNLSMTSTNVVCFGDCNGTATVTVTGGTPPYQYLWSNSQVLPNIVNLCPNTYTVTVTDANGCTDTAIVTITEPPLLTLTLTSTTPTSCNTSCDGVAIVSAGGGSAPYTFSWNPGNFTNDTVSTLCSGPYNVTVTDANGCSVTIVVNITSPPPILPNVQTFDASCNNSCNGSAISNPSGGTAPYTYLWMPGNLTGSVVNGLCPGSYTLTVTDGNGCTGSTIFVINQPPALQPGGSIVNLPTCPSGCNGSLTSNPVGGTPPYTYLWQWNSGSVTGQTATGLCGQTTYTLTVTDANGCTGSQVMVLNDPPPITVVSAVGQANCGVCNGTITIAPSGGTPPYTYLWTPGNFTTQNISNLCAGIYTVVITDNNGCTSSILIGVSNTTGPTLTMSVTPETCQTTCDGTATVAANGSGPFTYLWSNGQTTTTITGLCSGSYLVQVTDANGCITVDSVLVTQPPNVLPNATIVNAQCSGINNGSISLVPSGGNGGPFTFSWSTGATTSSITGLAVGVYTVTVTDASGCPTTFTFNVFGNSQVNFSTTSTNIICSNSCTGTGTAINISGGNAPYTFNWSDPNGQFTANATGLCAGTWSVTVTDANGCMSTQSVTITQTPAVTISASVVAPACGQCNGQITVTPSGGVPPFTYLWSFGQTTATVTGICAGIYSVQVTDVNGCTSTFSIPVSNPGGPNPNVVVTSSPCFSNTCSGSAISTPSGGTAPYTFNWLPGGQTTNSVTGLCAGTFYLQVTDANGCITSDTVVITSPSQIVSNQLVINPDCGSCNGSITTSPSGGVGPYTYLWQPGNQTTSGISNLCQGVYTVTITDASGCTQSYSIPLSSVNGPVLAMSSTQPACNSGCNGTATVTITGGTAPYTILWSPGNQTTATITGQCAGTYTVTVTDANNCTANAIVTILQPSPILFSNSIIINPLCTNDCNGSITVVPGGGTPPLTFSWSTGATTQGIGNLCPGTYVCFVTDVNGCTDSIVVTLTNPPSILVSNIATTDASCNTVNDAAIDITVTGGTGQLNYLWSNGATTEDLTNILAGTYIVTITDVNGCSVSDTITVNALNTVIADAGNDTTACEGINFNLDGSGSTNATTYQWFEIPSMTNIGNTAIVTITNPTLGTTNYILIVTNGPCSDTDTVSITVNSLPFANAGSDQTIVIFGSTTIGGAPTGPSGSTYSWSPGVSVNDSTIANPLAFPTVTTTYTVIVTNASGCTAVDSVTITVLPQIIFPNGISPNGDGSNDTWVIDNIGLFPNNIVEVYNRWGELLFHADGYDNVNVYWDGKFKKKDVPVGTYYYIINLNDPRYPDVFTGPITVFR